MNRAFFQDINPDLFNTNFFKGNIDISYSKLECIRKHLYDMHIIRMAEEKISDKVIEGLIKCPCHLGIGQEAIAVGISSFLRKSDTVFGAHRSHSHFLAMNNDVYSLFAEVLGRFNGCSHGLGGSMHLIDQENGFFGSVPIVGATIPIAVGAGFSHKLDKSDNLSVSYFGDGATEEGVFHESLNLAKVNNLPVLFVCENNLFASHMHILERQPELSTIRYAKANGVEALIVDGNDISAVFQAAEIAVNHIRSKRGPFYLECITYRWKGHVGPSDDNDVGLQRSNVLGEWKLRDPIKRLADSLVSKKIMERKELEEIMSSVRLHVNEAWEKALLSDFPPNNFSADIVYSK